MAFCIIEENSNYKKYLLSMIINIDFIYKNYDIVIACSEETKKYILNFPLDFKGKINWILLNNLDNNNITNTKNIIYSIEKALNIYKEIVYIECSLFILNKIVISEEIKKQGIGYVSRSVGYLEDKLHNKYITNILYINDKKYIKFIDNYFSNILDEWKDKNDENYTIDKIKDINKRFNTCSSKLGITLKEYFNLQYFFNNETLISSEDFFAFNDKIELENIDSNFKIAKKFLIKKNLENEECTNNNEKTKDNYKSNDEKLINISALNIRIHEFHNTIMNLNKELLNRMAQFNIFYMLIVNLKLSSKKIEFIIPKKDGISIWDRNNDKPGLYELIDMITNNNDYFCKSESYVDYFSFNNFIITDKPSNIWLNNNIKSFFGLFLCNYDNTIEPILKKINKPNLFGFYYSDYPKLLENIREKNYTKKRYCIKVNKNDIIEYELTNNSISLLQKTIININTPEEMLNIIAESTFCLFSELDIHLLTNCLGLKCVPVFKKSFLNSNNIYELKENINYIVEPQKWNDIIDINELVNKNTKYYIDNIIYSKIIKNILNKLLDYSYKYKEEKEKLISII